MEAISSVPRKRSRIMDVLGFKDAGHVLKGFRQALDPAMGRWVSMLVGHLLAGVKDIFRNGAPNCLVIVMICTVVDAIAWSRAQSWFTGWLHCKALNAVRSISVRAHGERICSNCEHCSWNSAPRCHLAKLRDQNLRNIVELIQNNLLRSLGNSAQTTYLWKCVIPNAKLSLSLKKWTEADRIAEAEAAAGSGSKASAAAAGSDKQPKGAKGSSSATAKTTTTAKSKAAATLSAAGSSHGLGSQKAKKPPLPPPADPPQEVDSSEERGCRRGRGGRAKGQRHGR